MLILILLFFPVRVVFQNHSAFLTGNYSDFTSFSFFVSDIILLILGIKYIKPRGNFSTWIYISIFLVFWLILELFLRFNTYHLYFTVQILKLIVAYGTTLHIFTQENKQKYFVYLYIALSAIESLIILVQYISQKSIGLYRIGESHLNTSILGVAKIVSGGTTYIRGYGTFPHPNVAAAFLVISVLFCFSCIFNNWGKKWVMHLILFFQILGVTLTFSRAGYFSLFLGALVFFSLIFFFKLADIKKQVIVILLTLAYATTIFFGFKPFILTRATYTDRATIERGFYNKTAIQMIRENPLTGVGIGESVLHMQQYSGKDLEPWQKQPPHNYFLAVGSELGIVPLLFIILFIFRTFIGLQKKIREKSSSDRFVIVLCISILVTVVALMQFDHYFYTLEQGKLLLVILLAFISSQLKNSQA